MKCCPVRIHSVSSILFILFYFWKICIVVAAIVLSFWLIFFSKLQPARLDQIRSSHSRTLSHTFMSASKLCGSIMGVSIHWQPSGRLYTRSKVCSENAICPSKLTDDAAVHRSVKIRFRLSQSSSMRKQKGAALTTSALWKAFDDTGYEVRRGEEWLKNSWKHKNMAKTAWCVKWLGGKQMLHLIDVSMQPNCE